MQIIATMLSGVISLHGSAFAGWVHEWLSMILMRTITQE
jgi:hypothetical protein